MGDAEVDWEVVEEELSQLPDAWKQARFDSLPHVVDVLTASEGGILDGLREQRDAVEELVDDVVQGYHNGFNRAIHNYSQILRLFSESASKMAGLKTNLGEARRLLAARHKALQQQWYRSITLRHVLQLLDQIDSVAKVPARIERLMLERKYYAATQLLLHSSSMLEREGIQGVGGLRDVRSDMQRLRQGLFTKVMEELHLHIYNKGTYSLASTRIADKDDDARPGQKRSVRKKGSPFSPLRLVGSTDDVRLRLGGTPDRNGRPRGDDHDGAMSEDGSISGSIIASVTGSDIASLPSSILRKSSSQARQQSGQLPIWLTDATPNEFTDSITRADSHDSVKYLQTLVECLALLGKLAAAGSSLAQRLRRTLRELIADVIKARAQAAERARPRVDSIPKTSAGGSPMTFSGASSHGTKMVAHSPRGGFAGGRIGVTSAGMTSAAGGGPTGPASVAAQQLLEEVFGVCVGALENHRLVHTFMQMRGAEDQSARQVLSPPRDENSGDGFKAGGGELAPYNLAVAWSCVQSECQALVCEVLRATPAGVSADPTGLGEGVKEGEKKAGAPGGAAAKEAEGALEGEDEELAFAFRFTDLGSALPGSETGSSTLVRGGDGALQSRSRRASATGQETYETELVLPERGVYLAAAVYRPVVQFTDKAAQIVKDAALKQGGGEALRAWMEKYIANAFLPRVQNDYRGRIADALSSPAAFKPRGRTSETYDRTVEKGRPVLQGGLAAESLVLEVLAWAQALPLFAGQLVGVVQAMLERLLERCRAAYTEAVLGSLSSALAARFDFENLQKRETAFMALFAEPAGGAGQLHVAELEGREEEAEALEEEMFHLIEGQQPIKSEHLIMDFSKVVLLAALSDSLDWLGDVISQLGSGGMTSSSSVVSPVTSPLQERERARARWPPPLSAQHRRGSSQTLTSGLAILADKFHNLSVEFIRTLRLEMQLQTAYHFQDMTDRSYVCDVEPEEPDEYVLSLTTQMSRLDDEVSSYVPPVRRSYAFGGVCGIAARCAIANLGRMKAINHLGVRQVARDCIALQQTLANLGTGGDYASLQRAQAKFDRVRQYYELLTIPVESLIAFAQDHPGAYSPEEFRKLLMVQVPGREVPTDAMHKLVRTFAR